MYELLSFLKNTLLWLSRARTLAVVVPALTSCTFAEDCVLQFDAADWIAAIAAAFVTASARQGTSKISRAYSGFAMTSRQNG